MHPSAAGERPALQTKWLLLGSPGPVAMCIAKRVLMVAARACLARPCSDGRTYSNPCEANCAGVKSYKAGECTAQGGVNTPAAPSPADNTSSSSPVPRENCACQGIPSPVCGRWVQRLSLLQYAHLSGRCFHANFIYAPAASLPIPLVTATSTQTPVRRGVRAFCPGAWAPAPAATAPHPRPAAAISAVLRLWTTRRARGAWTASTRCTCPWTAPTTPAAWMAAARTVSAWQQGLA